MFHCCCTQCHLVSFCCASEQRRRFSAAWESCKSAGWSKVTKWGALLLLPPEPQLLEEKNSPQKQRSILHSKTVPAWSASYKSSPKLPFFFSFLEMELGCWKKENKARAGKVIWGKAHSSAFTPRKTPPPKSTLTRTEPLGAASHSIRGQSFKENISQTCHLCVNEIKMD